MRRVVAAAFTPTRGQRVLNDRCGITRCLVDIQKRGFALAEGAKPIDGEGAEWVIYPRERPGRDSAFNQSLNRCRVSVKGDAFLNPTHQDLIARAKSSPPVGSKPDSSSKTLPVLEAGTDSLSFKDFDDIMDGAVRQLSSGKKDLLVADGTIGSFRGMSVAVRVISDLPSTCLTARHLLIPSPVVKYVNAHSLVPPVVVYVTSECKKDACAIQYVSESGGSGKLQGASIVLTGAAASSQNGLSDALHLACKSITLDKSETSVVLPAMGLRSGTKTGMYFGAGPTDLAQAHTAQGLYTAHHCTLSSEGLSAFWGGAIASNPTGELAMVSVPADNLISFPSAIFFASKEGKRKKTVSMKLSDVIQELKSHDVDDESIQRFTPALESGQINAFSVASVAGALKSLGKQ